jgi:hypothetical protein
VLVAARALTAATTTTTTTTTTADVANRHRHGDVDTNVDPVADADAAVDADADTSELYDAPSQTAPAVSSYPPELSRQEITISRAMATSLRIKCNVQLCVFLEDNFCFIIELDVHRTANEVLKGDYAVAKKQIMMLLVRSCPRISSIIFWHPATFDENGKRLFASFSSPWLCVKPAMDYILVQKMRNECFGVELFVTQLSSNVAAGTVASSSGTSILPKENWLHAGSAATVEHYIKRFNRWNELRKTGMKNADVAAQMNITSQTHSADKKFVESLSQQDINDKQILALTKEAFEAQQENK